MIIRDLRIFAAVACAAALSLAGCAGGQSSSSSTVTETVTVTSTPEVTDSSQDDPVVEPSDGNNTPSPADFTSLKFGEALPVGSTDGASSLVTLGQPELADCQYSSIGCDAPEIGDRVVRIPILIENTGSSTVEWGRDFFVLEFDDGTQVEMGDGASSDYAPDNALSYDAKVRVGGKLNSLLVFEAPEGPFSVLVLTSSFGGEPFAAWS